MIKAMYVPLIALTVVISGVVSLQHQVTEVTTSVIAEHGRGGVPAMVLPTDLTTKQKQILQLAYDIAKHDGHKHPEILQGIVFQETKAGGMTSYRVAGQEFGLKTNERYYGVTQIKLAAARDVLKAFPELVKQYLQTTTDEEVIAHLIMNDRFNLTVASKYLKLMPDEWSTEKKVAAYNQGPTGVAKVNPKTFKYVTEVKKHIDKYASL